MTLAEIKKYLKDNGYIVEGEKVIDIDTRPKLQKWGIEWTAIGLANHTIYKYTKYFNHDDILVDVL